MTNIDRYVYYENSQPQAVKPIVCVYTIYSQI